MINLEQMGGHEIYVISRTESGKRYMEKIEDFFPYFYDENKKRKVFDRPNQIKWERDQCNSTYEADIPYLQRFLIDRHKTPLPEQKLRICYLDIEVLLSLDTENTPEPVISITCYDNFLDKYIQFVWRKDIKPETFINKQVSLYKFNTEEDMLNKFIEFINDTQPDVMTGWNVEKFDLAYLINRARKLKLLINKISPFSRIYVRTKEEYKDGKSFKPSVSIKGIVIFDMLKGYRKLNFGELSSYSLAYVAEKEKLSGGKLSINPNKMWEDIDKLLEYNKRDVEICKALEEKKGIISYYNTIRRIVGCTWDYVWYNSMIADVLMLREARKRGVILPTNREKEAISNKGAFVMKTIPGVHKGVFLLDLKGLYPSIMRQFNMSPETLDKNGDIKINYKGKVDNEEIEEKIISFISKEEGMIPTILNYLEKQRNEYKEMRKGFPVDSDDYKKYDDAQYATKELMSSMYGAVGFYRWRMFEPDIAKAITFMGREILNWTIQRLEKFGFKIIYADTDSVFIETLTDPETGKKVDINKEKDRALKIANESYLDFVKKYGCKENTYLKLEYKCSYEKIIFIEAQKKYLGIITDLEGKLVNKTEIKGFEIKRSDHNKIGKEIQEEVLMMILNEKTKDNIDEFINDKQKEIRQLTDLNLLAIPKSVKKNLSDYAKKTPVIRGCEFSNQHLGTNFGAFNKMKFLYVKRVKVDGKWIDTDSICWEVDPPEVEVNWNKMIELTITNKTNRIYKAMGWDIITDIGNETLGKWFK